MAVGQNPEIDFLTRIANLEGAVFGGPNPAGGGAQLQDAVAVLTGSTDAIPLKSGMVFINSTGVDATTINAPIAGNQAAGGDDGKVLTIYCLTAHAHTVTAATNCINGSSLHIITFTAAALNYITLKAYNGIWYVQGNLNGTLS